MIRNFQKLVNFYQDEEQIAELEKILYELKNVDLEKIRKKINQNDYLIIENIINSITLDTENRWPFSVMKTYLITIETLLS